jgi:hypothetical protein
MVKQLNHLKQRLLTECSTRNVKGALTGEKGREADRDQIGGVGVGVVDRKSQAAGELRDGRVKGVGRGQRGMGGKSREKREALFLLLFLLEWSV